MEGLILDQVVALTFDLIIGVIEIHFVVPYRDGFKLGIDQHFGGNVFADQIGVQLYRTLPCERR